MNADVSCRVAWADDAPAIAAVQVRAWRASYAGVLPADLLAGLDVDDLAAGWRDSLSRQPDARHRVLVALERNNGVGVRQAMEAAAEVGDSWVFTRLSEELIRSRWSGLPPWDALHTLATELGLPELDDFADIMRLSGEEGAGVYATLRARSAAMRTAMLNDEIAQANAVGERMTIPGSLLGVIFMALLVAPSLLRMFTSS